MSATGLLIAADARCRLFAKGTVSPLHGIASALSFKMIGLRITALRMRSDGPDTSSDVEAQVPCRRQRPLLFYLQNTRVGA